MHLFECEFIDPWLNNESREDMGCFLYSFVESSAHWVLFKDLGLVRDYRRFL